MWLHTRGLGCDRHMDAADTPISEILAAGTNATTTWNGDRGVYIYGSLFKYKFQFHELAARSRFHTYYPSRLRMWCTHM